MTAREIVEIILSVLIAVVPIGFLIHRTIAKKSETEHFGIGVRSVQFVGVAMLLPTITVLALERLIDGSTVSALIGALIGYLFAGITDFDRNKPRT